MLIRVNQTQSYPGAGGPAGFRGTTLLRKLQQRALLGLTPVLVASDIDHTFWMKERADVATGLHAELTRRSIPTAYVTGRSYSDVGALMRREGLPTPDMLASSVGTQRYLNSGRGLHLDPSFQEEIRRRGFEKEALAQALKPVLARANTGLVRQPHNQGPEETNKLSYYVTLPRRIAGRIALLREELQAHVGRRAKVVVAQDIHHHEPDSLRFCIDLLPVTKEQALSDVLALDRRMQVLTAGDSGNDAQLLLDVAAPGVSVVVGGAKDELVSEVLRRTQPTAQRYLRTLEVPSGAGPIQRWVYMGTHAPGNELGPDSIVRALALLSPL